MAASTYYSAVQQMYVAYYARPADPVGLEYWATAMDKAGGATAAMMASFGNTTESAALYGTTSAAATVVNNIYLNLFGRAAEAGGLLYWAGKITDGSLSASTVALTILQNAGGTDKTLIANKITSATAFTTQIASDATAIVGYAGTTAAAAARTLLSTVTSTAALTAAQITAGITTVTTAGTASTAVTGQTFTLTTGVDTPSSTTAGDTYTGLIDQATAANTTMNATDVIDGGAGTDTLNVVGVGTTLDVLGSAQVRNMEIVNIRATTANSLNASALGTTLTAVNSTGAGTVLVTNLPTGASIGITGNGTLVQGEVAFAPTTASSAITLNIAGGVNQTEANDGITAAGTIAAGDATGTATTAVINSTGAANITGVVDLANATLTSVTINAATNLQGNFLSQATDQVGAAGTVTISGAAASVVLTAALDNTITTINASGLSAGGVTATLGTGITAFTGGAGNDVVTTAATTTAGAVISGGAGTGDVLDLAATNDVSTAAKAAQYTNFETIRANASTDISLFGSGITGVQVGAATSAVVSGLTATQAANIAVRGDQTTAVTFSLAAPSGTADVLGLSLGTGLTTSAATSLNTSLVVTGFETLNLTTNAGPSATTANNISTIGAITGATLANINLKGGGFSIANAATTLASKIDGSTLTGVLTLGGTLVAGSSVTGGSAADALTIGAEGSTYTGGAGNDSFTTTSAILAADGTTDATLVGGDGTDTLVVSAASTLTDINFTNLSGFEAITLLGGAANESVTGLAAGAKAAFSTGMTVTTATALANDQTFSWSSGLYDKAVTLSLTSLGVGNTTADNISIATGSGADSITVSDTAWVGATGGAAGILSVSTGAGNDTISVTTGTILAITTTAPVIITGGTGADRITTVGVNAATGLTVTYAVGAGDSTITAYDSITGFDMGSGALFSSTLDFASVGLNAYTATAATGFTAAQLTVAVSAAGLVTFAGTSAADLTLAQKISAVQSVVATTAGDSALFTHGANSYVFNNNATADSVVELVGITGLSLVTANATTAGAIFIA